MRGGSSPKIADIQNIRTQVRRWLTEGSLPSADNTVWAGSGRGFACAVCRAPILVTDVEYEVRAPAAHLRAHLVCYNVWKEESAKLSGVGGTQARRE